MKMQANGRAAVSGMKPVAVKISSTGRARLVTRCQAVATKALSKELVDKCVNTIRFVAIDAVNKSKSGHPGMPMGCAPMGYVLWNETMKYNPKNPDWLNRDRFVLSAGHGSMFQYAMMHLTGYDSVSVSTRAKACGVGFLSCLALCRWTTSSNSGSGARRRPVTPRTSSPRAWRSRLVRQGG